MKSHPFLSATIPAFAFLFAFLFLIPSAPAAKKQKAPPSAEDLNPTQPWPPAYMANLPKDYLDRIHQSLLVITARGDKLKLSDALKEPPSNKTSVAWTRWGQGGLTLGIRAGEINEFIASPAFDWAEHDTYAFGFFSTQMFRLYGLFKADSPYMPGRLTPAAQANMEKGFWATAKKFSKLDHAQKSSWIQHGSENHNMMEMTGQLLAAQFLRNNPAYAKEKYDDGTDLKTMYQAWNKRYHEWLDTRVRAGLFTEWGSPSYDSDIANAILNVRDFAEDPVLRKKAEMFLHLYFAAVAEENIAIAGRGGAKMRTKNEHLFQTFDARGYDVVFNAPGRVFEPLGDNFFCSTNYYPPAAVVDLAKDMTGRGPYASLKRVTGVVEAEEGRGFDRLSAEQSLPFYLYATPHYVVGSNFWNTESSYASAPSSWQGVIFDGAPTARIGFYIKPAKKDDWHLFQAYVSAQDRNVLVVQKWHTSPPNKPSHQPSCLQVYFPVTLDSVVEDESGWIFVQSGKSYAAVKVVKGGYTWNEKWTHGEKPAAERCTITLEEDAPVIVVANDASDYDNDFEAFKKAVKAQPVSYADGTLKFATITFFGTKQLPQINGTTVDLSPARLFDSPFIRSEWNSGLVYIRKGKETLKLDFTDSNNPMQTASSGEGDIANFPPGEGNAAPIVFRSKVGS